jgi:hypothetical protein
MAKASDDFWDQLVTQPWHAKVISRKQDFHATLSQDWINQAFVDFGLKQDHMQSLWHRIGSGSCQAKSCDRIAKMIHDQRNHAQGMLHSGISTRIVSNCFECYQRIAQDLPNHFRDSESMKDSARCGWIRMPPDTRITGSGQITCAVALGRSSLTCWQLSEGVIGSISGLPDPT